MAVTLVQVSSRVQASNSTSVTVSLPGVTAGNLLVAVVSEVSNSTGSLTTSTSGWTAAGTAIQTQGTTSKAGLAVWYIENTTSGSHSIVINGPAGWWNAQIFEFSGVATSSSLYAATLQQDVASTTGASTAAITAASGDLVIAVIDAPALTNTTNLGTPATPGYTDAANYKGSTGSSSWDISYKASSGGSETASWAYSAVISPANSSSAILGFSAAGGGGGAAALAGSAADVATTSADLTTAIQMQASAVSAATASASISTQVVLVGNAAGQSSASAALDTGIQLASTPTAQSTASAALTTAIQLNAQLTTRIARASASGTLTSTSAGLQATSAAASTASAALSTAIQLNTNVASAASASASLTALAAGLNASATASATASAALSTGISLDAPATSVSASSGDLTTGIALSADSSASSSTTADLSTGILLTGVAASEALGSGDITVVPGAFGGLATMPSTATGDLTTAIQLEASAVSSFDNVGNALSSFTINPALKYREPSLTYVEYR